MKTVEFETELTGEEYLRIPRNVAETLPQKGKATVIVCVNMDREDSKWRNAAYEQFLHDDSEEDAIYDKYS